MKPPLIFRTIILKVFIFLLVIPNLQAQRIISKKYAIENGLSSNRIYSIVQDSLGFMWFGTDNGLNRFDGNTFKTYYFSNSVGSISSNFIRKILINKEGVMWLAMDNGINTYNAKTDTFNEFSVKTKDGYMIDCRVLDLIEDKDGFMWIATDNNGVFKYNTYSNELVLITKITDDDIALDNIITMHEDSKGNIWFGSYDQGLILYNKTKNSFTNFKGNNTNTTISDNSIHKIYEDSYGNIWIGTFQNGLDKFDYTTMSFTNFNDKSSDTLLYHIHDILEYKPGELIIASDNGIGLFNIAEGKIESKEQTSLKLATTSNKFIYKVFIDKEESLWLGSYFDGVDFYSNYQNNFKYFSSNQSINPQLGKVVNVITEDYFNQVYWIGTDDNGISYFNPRTKELTPFHTAKDIGSTYYCVHDIIFSNSKLYAATYERGLEVYDMPTKKMKSYLNDPNDPNSIPSSKLYTLYKASNGQIFIGTAAGLCYYNNETDNFTQLTSTHRISSIIEDDKGVIWFSTFENGLFSYDLRSKKIESYTYRQNSNNSIMSNSISTLAIDRKKQLWIGSFGYGICRYNRETNNFIQYKLELPNNVIASIVPDGDELWITTNNGLVLFNPESNQLKAFSKSNGLYKAQFTPSSAIKSNDGNIFLGTTDGFCFFNPKELIESNYNPNVLITNITLFGKSTSVLDNNSPLELSIEYTKQIKLTHKQSIVGFEFASLSYIAPAENQFRYKLDGFDKDWRFTRGDKAQVSYTNLPTGTYTLIVQGTNSDKVWSTNEATLKIIVLPPFYKSKIAYLAYVIIILSLIYLILTFYLRRTHNIQQEKINRINAEKKKELYNSKIEFVTNIAHEIRTPLSLIVGPLEHLMETKSFHEKYREYLNIMELNYKRLQSLVNELLDFRKVDSGVYKLNDSLIPLAILASTITERFSWSAKQRNINLHTNIPDGLSVIADNEALTKIISNLLTNSLKYAKSDIVISAHNEGDNVCILVTDNGVGIEDKEKRQIFEAFYQIQNNDKHSKPGIGIGLHMTRSLLSLMGGEIEVLDRNDNENGVSMCIRLPKKDESQIKKINIEKIEDIFIFENETEMINLENENSAIETIPTKELSVLVIDDNPEILDFISKLLIHNYFVISARSGEEAIQILENNQPDLIISDVMMDGMDGFELCKKIKTTFNTSHIPVILLTAKTDTKSKIEGLEAGADAYIEKPFSPAHLKAQLKNLLQKRKELKDTYLNTPLSEIHSAVHNKLDEEFIEKIVGIIHEYLSDSDFSVNILADELAISRTTVFSKIKAVTGMTPNDFIKLTRLKTAGKMMVETDYRITEIAYMVGFSSSSYFAKCFQKQFNMKPNEFMKTLKESKPIEL